MGSEVIRVPLDLHEAVHPELFHHIQKIPGTGRGERLRHLAGVGLLLHRSNATVAGEGRGLRTQQEIEAGQYLVNMSIRKTVHPDLFDHLKDVQRGRGEVVRHLATLGIHFLSGNLVQAYPVNEAIASPSGSLVKPSSSEVTNQRAQGAAVRKAIQNLFA